MKRLFLILLVITGSMVATSAYSQVYIHARVGFGIPAPRVYCAPPAPPVVTYPEYNTYPDNYSDTYSDNYYNDNCRRPVIVTPYRSYGYERYRYNAYPYYERHREHFYHERRWEHERGRHW